MIYQTTNTASTYPYYNNNFTVYPYRVESYDYKQYETPSFGVFSRFIIHISFILIMNEIFKYIFGVKKEAYRSIITQQKIPSKKAITKLSEKQASSIVGNFKKYIEYGICLGKDNVSKYSETNVVDFLTYLDTIDSLEPKEYLMELHNWMEAHPKLPTKPCFSDESTYDEHYINENAPVIRHLEQFYPDNFDELHEEILVFFTVNKIDIGEYYSMGDYLMLVTDIKEAPIWDPTANKIINFIIYNRIDYIGITHKPRNISHKNAMVCVDYAGGSPHIKLCYEGRRYRKLPTKYCVGSVKDLDLKYISENSNKFSWKNTMTSRIKYSEYNWPSLDVTNMDMDENILDKLSKCYILSNLYPSSEENIKKCEIGKFLDKELVKGDPNNLKYQSDYVDSFNMLFND